MGKLADIEREVELVEAYYNERYERVFELDMLKRFYATLREILDYDTLGETKNEM